MKKRIPEPTAPPVERAFLVGVEVKGQPALLSLEDSLGELSLLCETAGLEVVGETKQRLDSPHPNTFIGSGKVEEIRLLVEETLANVVVFDADLSPTHQRELEEKLGENVRVLDRTAVILDIFSQHANTREGILQVELAQYEYRLPRLTRAWTHLARQAGGGAGRTGSVGGVGLRGPGETQLEVDRREIHRRITTLKKELENVRAHRGRHRDQRRRTQIPIIALVGYTNSGKSTLLNHLSKADVYVADQLFATLDPTTRRVELPGGHWVLMTDTVGFIQKLPTQLIAAFRATLEEIAEADLLIHVVDITHPNAHSQWQAVKETLSAIDAGNIPVITALNKVDRMSRHEDVERITADYEDAIAVSALKGTAISDLLGSIERELFETYVDVIVYLPFQEGQLISLFHEQGRIESSEDTRSGVTIHGSLPGRLITRFQPFFERPKPAED
ncbi:MAG TPA: GTPase HflX [Longilinea sp.]|nr:GTPase HflX [Longilinea sp.]